jgi:hypothetical protein
VPPYAIQSTYPGLTCLDTGFCLDPLIVPDAGVPIEGAPNFVAVRVVFDKLLSDDSVVADTMVKPDAIQLLAPDQSEVATTKFWDRAGSPDFTSDVIKSPFGPALGFKTKAALFADSDYTIRLHPAGFRDRQGNTPVDATGAALSDPTDFKFHTEKLAPKAATSYPALSAYKMDAKHAIAISEVLHVELWGTVALSASGAPAAVTLTVDESPIPMTADQFLIYGPTKPDMTTKCNVGATSATSFSIFPAVGAWPIIGHYKLTVTYADAGGKPFTQVFEFDVTTQDSGGKYDVAKFPTPGSGCAT